MPGSYKYIWRFKEYAHGGPDDVHDQPGDDWKNSTGWSPAPQLIPTEPSEYGINERPFGSHSHGSLTQLVNIIDNYNWTGSPKSSRLDVPELILREERIMANPMINQIANNLSVGLQKGLRAYNIFKSEMDGGAVADALKKADDTATDLLKSSEKVPIIGDMVNAGKDLAYSSDSVMSAYEDLYYVKPTGFKYRLPYLENKYKDIQNTFDNANPDTGVGAGLFGGMAQGLSKIAAQVATSFNVLEPGTYIEQPKFYGFGSRSGKTYTVQFPLVNTGNDFQDVINNWQLLFLLIYQNTPNRVSRDLIDPPKIYEATVRGTWYSRWSYISSMSVEFLGATRKMFVPVPVSYQGDNLEVYNRYEGFETVIPDAYQIKIAVTELFAETQNSLYAMLREKQSLVSVTENSPDFKGLGQLGSDVVDNVNIPNMPNMSNTGSKAMQHMRRGTIYQKPGDSTGGFYP